MTEKKYSYYKSQKSITFSIFASIASAAFFFLTILIFHIVAIDNQLSSSVTSYYAPLNTYDSFIEAGIVFPFETDPLSLHQQHYQ